jgi:probable HAF family extracellular repeat protein
VKRYLATLLATVILAACRDGAQPVTTAADLGIVSTSQGPPAAYVPTSIQLPDEFSQGFAVGVNKRNQVVVEGRVINNGVWKSSHAFLWENGVSQDLGTLGGTYTVPTDINDRGQVVGWSRQDFAAPAHAFFWDQGTVQDLGEIVVVGSTQPKFNQVRINQRGQVLGIRPEGGAFLWDNGVTQTVALAFASGLNDEGQVAGWVWHDSAGVRMRRAAVWENGVVTELGTVGGAESWANDISNSGWVVGGSLTGPNEFGTAERHAFRWRDGVMEDLGRSGQMSSGRPVGWEGMLVNEPGQVAAKSTDLPFFWEHGTAQPINCGCFSFYPMDLNVHGLVVGWGGWVWRDGAVHNLEGEAPHRAIAINDRDVVVGVQGPTATVWMPVEHEPLILP